MICLTVLLAAGAVTFVEQDIPGVEVRHVNALTGGVSLNLRQSDLDGDGQLDLVLPRRAFFGRQGAFSRNNSVPLPEDTSENQPNCDVWEGRLFLRSVSGLTVLEWDVASAQWQTTLTQRIDWARPPESRAGVGGLCFERFLHDLDGEGEPELVLLSSRGVHVYASEAGAYKEAGCVGVLPEPRLEPTQGSPLWPRDRRRFQMPALRRSCRLVVEGNTLKVITREALAREEARFRTQTYTLAPGQGFAPAGPPEVHETRPLPAWMAPCRLNGDAIPDFAGGQARVPSGALDVLPVYEAAVSTDGGRTWHLTRTGSFPPRGVFLDMDGDGDRDLVAHVTGLFEGGFRETLARFITQHAFEHEVRVHFQDGSGGFDRKGRRVAGFTITLDAGLGQPSEMLERYRAGELVCLSGDFNGDGRLDALVRNRIDRLALFLNGEGAFPARPDATLTVQGQWDFSVADVDADGRSDVIVTWLVPPARKGASGAEPPVSRVFLAREPKP